MNKCRPLLSEGKIPKFVEILMDKYPKCFQPFAEVIVKTAESFYIQKLIQKKISTPENCIIILKNIATAENSKKLSIILSQIYPAKDKLLNEINDTRWGLVCLGAVGYVGDLVTIGQIQKIIHTNPNHDFKFEGARAIGNIASRFPNFAFNLIDFSKQQPEGYLYLQALKEMLSFRVTDFENIEKVIHFLFSKAEESDRETNKHLLAECIGHVAKICPRELKKILDSVTEMNPARRYIVASSLRYALEDDRKEEVLDETM